MSTQHQNSWQQVMNQNMSHLNYGRPLSFKFPLQGFLKPHRCTKYWHILIVQCKQSWRTTYPLDMKWGLSSLLRWPLVIGSVTGISNLSSFCWKCMTFQIRWSLMAGFTVPGRHTRLSTVQGCMLRSVEYVNMSTCTGSNVLWYIFQFRFSSCIYPQHSSSHPSR